MTTTVLTLLLIQQMTRKRRKKMPKYIWGIPAGVVLVGGAAAVYFLFLKKKKPTYKVGAEGRFAPPATASQELKNAYYTFNQKRMMKGQEPMPWDEYEIKAATMSQMMMPLIQIPYAG
jgi:hypothetical protein